MLSETVRKSLTERTFQFCVNQDMVQEAHQSAFYDHSDSGLNIGLSLPYMQTPLAISLEIQQHVYASIPSLFHTDGNTAHPHMISPTSCSLTKKKTYKQHIGREKGKKA